MISLYNAFRRASHGSTTVYNQQKQHLCNIDITTDPVDKLQEDIIAQLKAWMIDGEQIIFMTDANQDVTNPSVGGLVGALYKIGLREAITRRHKGHSPYNTYHRGSLPIDGIFTSPTIHIRQGGYNKFQSYSDHRLLWIDIDTERVFGDFMYRSLRPEMRRLRLGDPVSRKKFNNIDCHCENQNIVKRSIAIENKVCGEPNMKQKKY